MHDARQLTRFERLLSLATSVQPGEGRCVATLGAQALCLMTAYYLIRPVREALILTHGGAELRSYAVGAQALLLILIIPAYGALVRNADASRVFRYVNGFFATNLLAFVVLCQANAPFGFVFFVWTSIFGVMTVTQFWVFATDLFNARSGQRLFGLLAIGVSAGSWLGARLASAGFELVGPYGLMLCSAGFLIAAIAISHFARAQVPEAARSVVTEEKPIGGTRDGAARWLGGFALIARSRYLVAIALLVLLLNWITSTGEFLLSDWLARTAREVAPVDPKAYIGHFMSGYQASITLVGLMIQVLLVSRIIVRAGLTRALLVTPITFFAGYLLIGILPVFALLESVLIVQRSLDYSLLNTSRSALLLPASRDVKYQAKTTIDTFFYRLGDLLSTLTVFIGVRVCSEPRVQLVWLIVALGATMTLVAWLIGREYARRFSGERDTSGPRGPGSAPRRVVFQQ
jgi:AAA family ATP:ADP antiporter